MGFRIYFILIVCCFIFSPSVSAEVPLKAAFIRDHQLWMVEGDKEHKLTTGRHVFSPKWSHDGRFIAYLDGDENGEKTYLYVYDTK